ncbi:MAG: YhbD family protein [Sporolactobacillus sp.]
MDEVLITKKELLEETGISYGQLYRWKRKNLIPDEWFIRKSTFTGQETFFPKEKILKRVQNIAQLKDSMSLDQLAERFSAQSVNKLKVSVKKLLERNIVSEQTYALFAKLEGEKEILTFAEVLTVAILDGLLKSGHLSLGEAADLLSLMKANSKEFYQKNCCLYFIRKMGVSVFMIAGDQAPIYFDEEVRIIDRIAIPEKMESLAAKMNQELENEQSGGAE